MTDGEARDDARSAFAAILVDTNLMSFRIDYSRTVVDNLANIAGWLGVDSLFGGGDVPEAWVYESTSVSPPPRYAEFRGASAVVEMAAELSAGSVTLLDAGLRYAAAALVRQLIEAEYLLRAFVDDIARAAEWYEASPSQIRRSFMPKTMRPLGGFSDQEYWTHCDHSGHPSPHGRHLLRFGSHEALADDKRLIASSWADLAQHLRRVWAATRSLLGTHHARFNIVRVAEIEAVRQVKDRWAREDPLADPIDLKVLKST